MTVTVASFRQDFLTIFGNKSKYPDNMIQYWINAAQLLLGIGTGTPPALCSFTGAIGGVNPSTILTVSGINFGSLSLFPLVLEGENVSASAIITGQLTGPAGGLGAYQLNVAAAIAAENMVAIKGGAIGGQNPFWGPSSPTPDTPPTTVADLATEQWVAHQIVLESQAMQAAQSGGAPGTKIGIITSKSVNGVSVGFDVAAVTGGAAGESAGYYNQTIYGMRFWRLARARSAGPIQIGVGRAPPFLFFGAFGYLGGSNAWGGPFPGIAPSDTGF